MPPTSALNATGQVFESMFKQAFKLFRTHSFDEANGLALWLLQQPGLGDYHKAGAHLILAHSPDEYVAHASEAVRLYKGMYSDPNAPPTPKQKESQDELIAGATKVLTKALEDVIEYGGDELDMEELQKVIDADLVEHARLEDEKEACQEEEDEARQEEEDEARQEEEEEEEEDQDASGETKEAAGEIDINSLPLAELADDSKY